MSDQKQELTTQLASPQQNLPTWMAGITGRLDEALSAGEVIIKSGFAPKGYTSPQAVVVACAMGARLGLDPFSAMAGIAVVNGRPTLYGDAMLAVCQNHPAWGGMTVTWEGEGDGTTCIVTIKRKGVEPYSGQFSIREAQTAGLWNKQGPWTNHPRRMLEMRARGYALRGAFADALAGFMCREEMEDLKEVEHTVVETAKPEAARVSRPAQPEVQPSPKASEPTKTAARRGRTVDVKAESSQQREDEPEQIAKPEPEPAKPVGHPARVAANDLFAALKKTVADTDGDKSFPMEVMVRLSKLHGANSPKDIPDMALDALARDVQALGEVAHDLDQVESLLADWEMGQQQDE